MQHINSLHSNSSENKAFIDIRLHPGIATPVSGGPGRLKVQPYRPKGKVVVHSGDARVFAARRKRIGLCVAAPPIRSVLTWSIKPEVHNVLQRRQRRTEPRPQRIAIKHFAKISPAVPEICSQTDRQTNTQTHTHRQTDRNTPLPYLGGVTLRVWYLYCHWFWLICSVIQINTLRWLTDWLVRWLIDWLIDRLMTETNLVSRTCRMPEPWACRGTSTTCCQGLW